MCPCRLDTLERELQQHEKDISDKVTTNNTLQITNLLYDFTKVISRESPVSFYESEKRGPCFTNRKYPFSLHIFANYKTHFESRKLRNTFCKPNIMDHILQNHGCKTGHAKRAR